MKYLLLLILFLHTPLYAQQKKDTLVRLAVIDFANRKASKNHDYLSESIPDVIEAKLREIFEYQKISAQKSRRVIKKILRERGKELYSLDHDDIQTFTEETEADLVIYGEYIVIPGVKRGEIDRVSIRPLLYLSFWNKLITLETLLNKIDSSIFEVIQQVGDISLEKIKKIVNLEEVKERGKIRRYRLNAFAFKFSWDDSLYEIGINANYQLSLGNDLHPIGAGFKLFGRTSLAGLIHFFDKDQLKEGAWSRYVVLGAFISGVIIDRSFQSDNFLGNSIEQNFLSQVYAIQADIGYSWLFSKQFRLMALFTPGYYFSFSQQEINSEDFISSESSLDRNFIWGIHAEVGYLLISSLSLNGMIGYRFYNESAGAPFFHGIMANIGMSYLF